MKHVYLIVTDLHYNTAKEHRINYLGEVMDVLVQISTICEQYRKLGYTVYLIFLGDIIDGAISESDDAMRCLDLFKFYTKLFESTYAVVGNHEQHNTTSNPFWFLVSEIQDSSLLKLAKPLQPQGADQTIIVPDRVIDGEVTFYFNHYGVMPKIPGKEGVAIGLFHQNVGSLDICKMWGTFVDVEEAAFVQAYRYSFFGHMHLASGKYYLSEDQQCVGEWLGSCVGTNVTEVEQQSSQCNIPAVLIENGKFICVEDNYINRANPEKAIDYAKLKVTRAANEKIASVKNLIVPTGRGDTLYKRVCNAASEMQLGPLVEILSESEDSVLYNYKTGLQQKMLEE